MPYTNGGVTAAGTASGSTFCGNKKYTYINNGILIVLTLLALLVALKVAAERRAAYALETTTTTTTTTGKGYAASNTAYNTNTASNTGYTQPVSV
jgi:hypothetical protein